MESDRKVVETKTEARQGVSGTGHLTLFVENGRIHDTEPVPTAPI